MFIKEWLIAGFSAASVMATPILADTYNCRVNPGLTYGWIPPQYRFSYEPGQKSIVVETFEADGSRFSKIDASIVKVRGANVTARFYWKNAPAETTGPSFSMHSEISVAYTAKFNTETRKIVIQARIMDDNGRPVFARGKCVPSK